MGLKKLLAKKVSWLWAAAALVFWLTAVVEIVMLLLAGSGFNSLTDFIANGQIGCAEYCDSQGEPLYLHDVVTQACQCYSEDEKPTHYKNLQTGVEIQHQERDCLSVLAEDYTTNDCVFEGCEPGDALFMKPIGG